MEQGKIYLPVNASAKHSSGAAIRILTDLKEIQNDVNLYLEADVTEDSIFNWDITFAAPNGKAVKAELHFDLEYPYTPPKMFIKPAPFHPNISGDGEVCLQGLKEKWTPTTSVWSLILSTQALLSDPNPEDPANDAAAELLRQSPEVYHIIASECFNALDSFENLSYGPILQNDDSFSTDVPLGEQISLQITLFQSFSRN